MSPPFNPKIRHFLGRLTALAALSLAGVALVAYVLDYVVFRYRAGGNQAFGTVTVTNYDAVHQKNGKTEFLFDPPQVETCVRSLFPHAGYPPCWYLRRHAEQRTNI